MSPRSADPGRPLAIRLAVPLALAVVLVLLIAGVVVNRVVSSSFEQQLSEQQQTRLADAATVIGQLNRPAARALLRRLAAGIEGRVSLLDATGGTLATAGRLQAGVATRRIEAAVSDGPTGAQTLLLEMPDRGGNAFLRVFNVTLLVAGALSVLVLMLAAGLLSERVTRPLRSVAAAARQLGAGDLTARAGGGPDRESAELAVAFNAMADRLQRSEALRRRAASDMAHDLATPATVLESQLQAMVDGVVPADAAQLESARASAAALGGVVARMGELIAAESAVLVRRPERVDLAVLLDETRNALDGLFRDQSLRAVVEIPGGLTVEADRGQLSRALRNVLTNAAQHSPPGAEVIVRATTRVGVIEIRIIDGGHGIDATDLPHVFERFYRADVSRGPATSGSGIGLTIARELLAAHGGSIEVEHTGPSGTTFLVRLPSASPSA
jgi:signal transduction histidine kinase